MFGTFALHLNHGGKFVSKPVMFYSGGSTSYYYNVDADKMSYFELKGMVEDLGYTNMAKMYYLYPRKSMETGLRLIDSDKDIHGLLECVELSGGVEVYVEHLLDERVEGETESKGDDSEIESETESSEESDAASLDNMSEGEDEELIEVRQKIIDKKASKNKSN